MPKTNGIKANLGEIYEKVAFYLMFNRFVRRCV